MNPDSSFPFVYKVALRFCLNHFIFLFLLLIFISISCKKENTLPDHVSSPFKLTYEITSSEKLSSTAGSGLSVHFTNAFGTIENSLFNSTTPWIKEETVTESKRPFEIKLITDGIVLENSGYITGNIYINGVKKASFTSVTSKTSSIGGYNIAYLDAYYTVN